MTSMPELLRDLTPLNRVVCSSDYDRAVDYLRGELPFALRRFEAADEHNGWVIPPKWDVVTARIERDGVLVYDGTAHPLGVIALSAPFRGRVGREELRRHLHFDHRFDDALTFHFRQQFRSWSRDWGFCVPRALYDALPDGEYDVVIETAEAPGYLSVLEYDLPGRNPETILFGADLDHPGVANDGLAGVVVGMELFRRLAALPDRRFGYRLVLVQGIIGSEYYLARLPADDRARLLEGVFLEMLGSRTELALQRSREGGTNIEAAIARSLAATGTTHRAGAFESIIVNDEYVWEAWGIPMASLSRFPYPEYHSSKDDLSIIDERNLREAVDVLERAVADVERTPLVARRFEGTVCLSNPRYDLYVDPGQVAIGDVPDQRRRSFRRLMDALPALRRPVTVRQLALEFELPEADVLAYVQRWADKGLLRVG